jgi:hypothetical protein
MALSKVNLTNAISGTLPAGNVNNATLDNVTSVPGAAIKGSMFLISEQTASSSASIEFTTGIDSTYPIYQFEFINIHPASDNQNFQVNFRDGGSSFDATKTTTFFTAQHKEDDSSTNLAYSLGNDIAQGTGFQTLSYAITNDNDGCVSGELKLFNPSSTTFVKHFISRANGMVDDGGIQTTDFYVAGYCNTTTAIDGVQFKFASGNIDAGTIKLYGIKDS